MKKFILIFFIVFGCHETGAQIALNTYRISFRDKENQEYSLDHPEEFLSRRAIDRRVRYGISIDSTDLPVNKVYLDSLTALGLEIAHSSKWFNSAVAYTENPGLMQAISELDFVRSIKSLKHDSSSYVRDKLEKAYKGESVLPDEPYEGFYDYGDAYRQIEIHHGELLHNSGFRGKGICIAVLDGGFTNVDQHRAFENIRNNKQIIASRDFVKGGEITYDQHPHGLHVLSTMAANLPGTMVGTAPEADYILIRCEDSSIEQAVEEDHWLAAAEYADSLGTDIISSSIGYSVYAPPSESYSYEDMDGKTSLVTRAAEMAARKGILVVSSAGNEGNKDWHYITAPADGESVLTVGAINYQGLPAYFSSYGPTADGRIKPNVTAIGENTIVAGNYSDTWTGTGTSFSTPVVAGLCACLWQAAPELNNLELLKIIEQSGDHYLNPDYRYGYGIPDFGKAYLSIKGIDLSDYLSDKILKLFPNPFSSEMHFDFFSTVNQVIRINICDLYGKRHFTKTVPVRTQSVNEIRINLDKELAKGIYFLQIISRKGPLSVKILKN